MMLTKINFKLHKKRKNFKVVHNLEDFGLSIDAAFVNWSNRTNDYSIDSFCAYVMSKDRENLVCIPKLVWDAQTDKK